MTPVSSFPHICAGKDCAICGWVDLRNLRLKMNLPYTAGSESGNVVGSTDVVAPADPDRIPAVKGSAAHG